MRAAHRFRQIAFYLLTRIKGDSVAPPGSDFLVTEASIRFTTEAGDEFITE